MNNSGKMASKQGQNGEKPTPRDIWATLEHLPDNHKYRIRLERESPEVWNDVDIAGIVGEFYSGFGFEKVRDTFGGGTYQITVWQDGNYFASQRVRIPGPPILDHNKKQSSAPPNKDNNHRDNGNHFYGSDELDHALAQAVKYKSISEILRGTGDQNGANEFAALAKQMITAQLGKDPVKELANTFSQINNLRDLFGKGKTRETAAPATLESAIAESVPDIVDLVKKKWGSAPIKREEKAMDDLEYVIQKLYAMARTNIAPSKGVALALSVLTQKDINQLRMATPEQIIANISKVYPQMRSFLATDQAKLWITEFKKILDATLSLKEKQAQRPKSESSGTISKPAGATRTSSGKPKTSSGGSPSGTRTPKPAPSTSGPGKTGATPGKG